MMPVLSDDALRAHGPGRGQERLLVVAALDEPFGLEPLQHLACRCPRDAEHLGHARGDRRRGARVGPVLADREGEEVDRLEVLVDRMSLTLRHAVSLAGRGRADPRSSCSPVCSTRSVCPVVRTRSSRAARSASTRLVPAGSSASSSSFDRRNRLACDVQLVGRRGMRRRVRRLVVDRDQLERRERRLDVLLERLELLRLRLRAARSSPGRDRRRQRARARATAAAIQSRRRPDRASR